MANISKIKNCYGCGVCSAACPKKIISIHLNKNGFYEPRINNLSYCIDCGICLDVCAFTHKERALTPDEIQIKSWAAWSNDKNIRKKCSSGGIGFEIGKRLIENGYYAVGCKYNIANQRAEHFIATTVEEFVQSIGSKYIQSYTEEAFRQIKMRQNKYLIIGTPCQIDSFRRMIRKFNCENNFVLIDFYCHCVPSMYVWDAYMKMLEQKIGKVTYASWRNKFNYGWHDSWIMGIDGEKTSPPFDWCQSFTQLLQEKQTHIQSRKSQGDIFYKFFLGDVCSGPQCEKNCKYKYDKSSADIRIGDLWGKTYEQDQQGVSALVSFTTKGHEVIKQLQNISLIEHPFELVAEGQMKENNHRVVTSALTLIALRNGCKINGKVVRVIELMQMVCTKLRLMLK